MSQPNHASSRRLPRQSFSRRSPWAIIAVILLIALTNRYSQQPPPASQPQVPHTDLVRVKRVVDGDTLLLEGGERVRLLGIDTPETKIENQPPEPFGPEASEFTRNLVEGKDVRLEYDRERQDDYGRTLAYVYIGDQMLNVALIEAGLTRAETRFHFRADRKRLFKESEEIARKNRRGIWGAAAPSTPHPQRQ